MNGAERIREFHHEQVFGNSCLAACVVMVRLRRAEICSGDTEMQERVLMQRLGASPRGLVPADAAIELGAQWIPADPDDPGNLIQVRARVESTRWWHIVVLHPGPLIELQRQQRPQPRSRHGELAVPLPHHAVVLVGTDGESFLYLDPWFPRGVQPQTCLIRDFPRVWTGGFIPVKVL